MYVFVTVEHFRGVNTLQLLIKLEILFQIFIFFAVYVYINVRSV